MAIALLGIGMIALSVGGVKEIDWALWTELGAIVAPSRASARLIAASTRYRRKDDAEMLATARRDGQLGPS